MNDSSYGVGIPLLVVAVVASVVVGRAQTRRTPLRVLVLGVNVLAVLALPNVLDAVEFRKDQFSQSAYNNGFNDGYNRGYEDQELSEGSYPDADKGLAYNGRPVINVFPYDAQGKPLTGVQLFNENGEPIEINRAMATEMQKTITYPWLRAGASVWNVFPMPVGPWLNDPGTGFRSDDAWFGPTPPVIPPSAVVDVRPVSLPKVKAAQ